ncbi:MAG: single-stranded-DNA-specific exonuclease RecJ [Thermoflexales bacterium]|nr:single-stranded-DNA-specific exonuclease RecJ [Thermoflexales bacterium]
MITSPSPSKRWRIAPPAPEELLKSLQSLPAVQASGLLAQLLYNRGIVEAGQVERFLDPAPPLLDPLQHPKLKGLDQAVARLRQAIRRREPVAVYGDYDVDGVTATVLLVETLHALGADVRPYIPDRVDEGYGLNTAALDRLGQAGVRVVVTVDCGARAVEQVAFANEIGLDVVITDHHQPADKLPACVACINPRQTGCPYPFKELAGVGLAFKLAQALLIVEQKLAPEAVPGTPGLDGLLDLVALGTVADLAPLLGENRVLVSHGLASLNRVGRVGMSALMNVAGIRAGAVDAAAIGFGLGPRLNAAGRIEHAMAAYRLLTTRDEGEALRLAEELEGQNRERQRLTRETQERARELALAGDEDQLLLFAASPDFLAGVVGLAASRLVEEFYRPAVVVEQGEEESHGSCRSIAEFHVTHALDQCTDLLVRHGGHAAAAGFTVRTENLLALAARLRAAASEQLKGRDLRPSLPIDCEWPLDALNPAVFQVLRRLEPCGYDNPVPLLCSRAVRVVEARPVGKDEAHLKLRLGGARFVWDAIAFWQGGCAGWLRPGMPVDIVYGLEENEWNGQTRLQLNVRDLRPTSRADG